MNNTSHTLLKCLLSDIKNIQTGNLPSLHRGPPKVVMLQSQLKPSHCCRQTPWLAHESSWQVVLGPEDGERPQPRELGFIRRGRQVCSAVKWNVTPAYWQRVSANGSAKANCVQLRILCFLSNTNANMQIVKVAWIKANYILVKDQAKKKKQQQQHKCVCFLTFEVF